MPGALRRPHAALCGALAALLAGAAAAAPAPRTPPASAPVAVAASVDPLARLYRDAARAPLWLDASGRPNADARDALALLAAAADEGLDPAAYRAGELAAQADRGFGSAGQAHAWDVEVSRRLLDHLNHLHAGRVDPRALGFRIDAHAPAVDVVAVLAQALAAHRVRDAAAQAAPPLPQYRSLRAMLARYRLLAAAAGPDPLPAKGPAVRPGDPLPDAAALGRRLHALGDLPVAIAADATHYDAALADAVRRFQARHGLAADGVIGAATRAALGVPLERRVRQIELAMERLRWLPRLDDRRFVAIDIPLFRLWAVDPTLADGAAPLSMGVVVGRALRTPTPVLWREIREVIFRPSWNVPRSIVRHEMLPEIARDPGYLRRHEMELVRGDGDAGVVVEPTEQHLAELAAGSLRLRQRPGPRNALGLVKFVFPNEAAVYLHGTPAPSLFGRPRRDFSHGCVRLEDPVALALWALRGHEPAWTRERIEAAMAAPRTQHVALKQPVGVLLYYVTAVVVPEDGAIHFADDVYGHDRRLEQALAAAR